MAQRGSIRRRGKTWTAYWWTEDPPTGRRRQRSRGGFQTRKAAQGHLNSVLGAIEGGSYSESSKGTLEQFLAEWLKAVAMTLRPNTLSMYTAYIDAYIVPRLGGVKLRALSPAQLNGFYADLLVSGRRVGGGGLAPRSVRINHVIIRRALADAVRWGYLARSVADLADPPKDRTHEATCGRPTRQPRSWLPLRKTGWLSYGG